MGKVTISCGEPLYNEKYYELYKEVRFEFQICFNLFEVLIPNKRSCFFLITPMEFQNCNIFCLDDIGENMKNNYSNYNEEYIVRY